MEKQKVVLYSTHCPKCRVLERKLNEKNIPYTVETDIHVIMATGKRTAPLLGADGRIMEFSESLEWVKNYAN